MSPEELIKRLKDGTLKPIINNGRLIAMENEEGTPYPIEFIKHEELPSRVFVTKAEAYLEKIPSCPVLFSLLLDSKINYSFEIISFSCRVSCQSIPLQIVQWHEGDDFASNGLKFEASSLPGLGSGRFHFYFNSYICPRLPYDNRWQLDGIIELRCPALNNYEFPVRFYQSTSLKEEDWKGLLELFEREGSITGRPAEI